MRNPPTPDGLQTLAAIAAWVVFLFGLQLVSKL